MDRESARIYRNRLRALRARLRDDVTQLAFTPDCEMTMQLWAKKEQMLQYIEDALEQIENGTYGRCRHCGRRIVKARLMAVPYTGLCTACAARIPDTAAGRGQPGESDPREDDECRASAGFERASARAPARSRNPKEDAVCGDSLLPGRRGARRGQEVG
jgi:RNA polymerase-binding transcription factor DksA